MEEGRRWRERRRPSGRMVVGEKREGTGGSVVGGQGFIGQGWAVSHGHSLTARIETQPGPTSTIAFFGRDADGRSTQFSAVEVEVGPAGLARTKERLTT